MNFTIGTLLMCHLLVSQPDGAKKDLKLVGELIEKTTVTQYIDDSKNNETYRSDKEMLYVQGEIDGEEYFINVSKTACRPILTEEERKNSEKSRILKNKKIAEAKAYNKAIEEDKNIEVKKVKKSNGPNPIAFKKDILKKVNKALAEPNKEKTIKKELIQEKDLNKAKKEEPKKDSTENSEIDKELESLGL